jgi:hypothetical protein
MHVVISTVEENMNNNLIIVAEIYGQVNVQQQKVGFVLTSKVDRLLAIFGS